MKDFFLGASRKAREKRAAFFRSRYDLNENTKILDIGSETGYNIHMVLRGTAVKPENVYIADINKDFIEEGHRNYGYNPVLVDESGRIPFPDKNFDLVFCSSVIEHVTVAKEEMWGITGEKAFREKALKNQQLFANEVRRVGKAYYVQTPYKGFFIESHTWLPFLGYLPRPLMLRLLKFTNKVWVKSAPPDFNLLGFEEMNRFFPDAEIVPEKKFGMVKSLMAISVNSG